MRTVLAALDASPAARPVLETALGIGQLTSADVEAVHVGDGSVETPATLAARCDVPYRLFDGAVEASLLGAVDDPAVIVAVLGARGTPAGRRPAGRTALHVMERARQARCGRATQRRRPRPPGVPPSARASRRQ